MAAAKQYSACGSTRIFPGFSPNEFKEYVRKRSGAYAGAKTNRSNKKKVKKRSKKRGKAESSAGTDSITPRSAAASPETYEDGQELARLLALAPPSLNPRAVCENGKQAVQDDTSSLAGSSVAGQSNSDQEDKEDTLSSTESGHGAVSEAVHTEEESGKLQQINALPTPLSDDTVLWLFLTVDFDQLPTIAQNTSTTPIGVLRDIANAFLWDLFRKSSTNYYYPNALKHVKITLSGGPTAKDVEGLIKSVLEGFLKSEELVFGPSDAKVKLPTGLVLFNQVFDALKRKLSESYGLMLSPSIAKFLSDMEVAKVCQGPPKKLMHKQQLGMYGSDVCKFLEKGQGFMFNPHNPSRVSFQNPNPGHGNNGTRRLYDKKNGKFTVPVTARALEESEVARKLNPMNEYQWDPFGGYEKTDRGFIKNEAMKKNTAIIMRPGIGSHYNNRWRARNGVKDASMLGSGYMKDANTYWEETHNAHTNFAHHAMGV